MKPGYALRRARLLAARRYPPNSICRVGILGGQWDTGEVVRSFMEDRDGEH